MKKERENEEKIIRAQETRNSRSIKQIIVHVNVNAKGRECRS